MHSNRVWISLNFTGDQQLSCGAGHLLSRRNQFLLTRLALDHCVRSIAQIMRRSGNSTRLQVKNKSLQNKKLKSRTRYPLRLFASEVCCNASEMILWTWLQPKTSKKIQRLMVGDHVESRDNSQLKSIKTEEDATRLCRRIYFQASISNVLKQQKTHCGH